MTADTDTPNPRDGLTDADILALHKSLVDRNFPVSVADFKEYVRVIQREIRAADREARPAPASVEALTLSFDDSDWITVRRVDWNAGRAAIDRLAAASTPPAEAPGWRKLAHQFDGQRMAAMWHLKALLADPAGHAEKVREFIAATPDKQIASVQAASEARATGDAALKLADDLDAAVQIYPQVSEDDPGGYCTAVDQLMAEAAAELRRLAATGAAGEPQPREGWKWVPVEPTEAMIHAAAQTPGMKAIDAASAIYQLRGNPISPAVFKEGSPLEQAWAAMLAAVPQADSGAAGGQGDKP